jgi:hypothetical protein
LSSILYSIHLGIAAIAQQPIWQLSQDEADALGAAMENVAAQYDWLSRLTPEIVAWGNLATVAATIYGGRLVLLKLGAGRSTPSAASPGANGPVPRSSPESMAGLLHPHMTMPEING